MKKADFEKLADLRIREAKILLDAKEWDGKTDKLKLLER